MSISSLHMASHGKAAVFLAVAATEFMLIFYAGEYLSTHLTMVVAGGFTLINFLAFAISAIKHCRKKDDDQTKNENMVVSLIPTSWPIRNTKVDHQEKPKASWWIMPAAMMTLITGVVLVLLGVDSTRSAFEQTWNYMFDPSSTYSTLVSGFSYGVFMAMCFLALSTSISITTIQTESI